MGKAHKVSCVLLLLLLFQSQTGKSELLCFYLLALSYCAISNLVNEHRICESTRLEYAMKTIQDRINISPSHIVLCSTFRQLIHSHCPPLITLVDQLDARRFSISRKGVLASSRLPISDNRNTGLVLSVP